MDRFALLQTVTLCLLISSPAVANDGPVYFTGGPGGGLAPKTESDIEMVREHVVLRELPERSAWRVTCDFTFRNTAETPVETRVGFPYHVVPDDYPEHYIEDAFRSPEGYPPPEEHGDPLIFDFKVWIRGERRTDVERGEFASTGELELPDHELYTWTMRLEAGETVEVRNEYLEARSIHTGRGPGEETTTDLVDYIVQTGGLWKGGEIGEATFEIHPRRGHFPCEPEEMAPEGGRVTRKEEDPGLPDRRGDEELDARYLIRWDLENFSPDADDDIDVELCSRQDLADELYMTYAGVYGTSKAIADGETDEQTPQEGLEKLRIARNKFYALEGYQFDSDDLADHFESKIWYRPDPDFSADELSERDFEAIKLIEEAESLLRERLERSSGSE